MVESSFMLRRVTGFLNAARNKMLGNNKSKQPSSRVEVEFYFRREPFS